MFLFLFAFAVPLGHLIISACNAKDNFALVLHKLFIYFFEKK